MPTYDDVKPALAWRSKQLEPQRGLTAERLVAALSVDQLPHDQIPEDVWLSVKAFRRLRTDIRVHVTRRYLSRLEYRRGRA